MCPQKRQDSMGQFTATFEKLLNFDFVVAFRGKFIAHFIFSLPIRKTTSDRTHMLLLVKKKWL
jgi:hypothetical protein